MSAVVIRGDAANLPLPDASVDLICTSPPYFGLRSYTDNGVHYDGQIGSEATPAEYVEALIRCTRDWVRVLKPEGSLFVNLGDKYVSRQSGYDQTDGGSWAKIHGEKGDTRPNGKKVAHSRGEHTRSHYLTEATGLQPKSLLGLPWRYALAATDQLGLILRRDIIWSKPNGLPESVQDRCRSSHEYVFHLVKQPRYFSAVDEVRESYEASTFERNRYGRPVNGHPSGEHMGPLRSDRGVMDANPLGKLPGSVWTIPSQPLTVPPALGVDHFAAFPMELPRRIILGWSPGGVCTGCGQGRRPVVQGGRNGDGSKPHKAAMRVASFDWAAWKQGEPHRITGYTCACPPPDVLDADLPFTAPQHDFGPPIRPAVVLDPFGGTGTTALVAGALGRHAITVDMSADYCRLAAWRLHDSGERARAAEVPKPPPVHDDQMTMFDLAR